VASLLIQHENEFVSAQQQDFNLTSYPTFWHGGLLCRDINKRACVLIPSAYQAGVLRVMADTGLSCKDNLMLLWRWVYWDEMRCMVDSLLAENRQSK
jgi:hypothetical protein